MLGGSKNKWSCNLNASMERFTKSTCNDVANVPFDLDVSIKTFIEGFLPSNK